jgi:hypothetical protein
MANCIVCDKELVIDHWNPLDGTIWTTNGNYGSTVYDNEDGLECLVTYICDVCLVTKKKAVLQRKFECKRSKIDTPFNPEL